MINRIVGGLILLIGLNSVHAQDELSVIREPSAVEDCKEESSIIPTCLFSRKVASSPAEMITTDLKVCGCMKKSNFLFESTLTPISKDELEKEKKRKLQNLDNVSGNSSVLQASSSSKSKKDQDISLLVYGGQETRANLKEKKDSQSTGPKISNSLTQVNAISEENKAWQCVTYQEYSVQRELPSENDFFKLLSEPNFKPEEWNVNTLSEKYDAANENDKKAIRLKMSFLSRNPIFQTIMKAQPTDKNPAAKILAKQQALYSVLRLLAPAADSTCMQVPNKCFQELLSSGKYQQYTDGVSRFLVDFDVIDIASSQAAADYAKELKRITDSGQQGEVGSVPTDPEGYFNYLQTANQQLLKECSGQQVKPECYTKFAGHCSHIQAIDQRVREGIKLNSGEISNILREEESVHATLDPDKNPSFKAFNEKICLDPYSNAAGEKLNYFQYEQKYCSGAEKIPECSDRKNLLTRFLNEYSSGEVEADRNLRTAFSKIISDKKFQDISEAQVLAANNVSESPAELRARFGGSFPDITPKGILAPPAAIQPQVARSTVGSSIPDYSDIYSGSSSSSKQTDSYKPASFSDDDNRTISNSRYVAKPLPELTVPKLPGADQRPSGNFSNLPAFRKPAANDSDDAEYDEPETRSQSRQEKIPRNNPAQQTVAAGGTSGGGGGGGSGSSGSGSTSAGSVESSGGGTTEVNLTNPSRAKRSRGPAGSNLLFKYGLDENNKPEVSLVNPSDKSEVKVSVDSRLLDRIKANPNSFEVNKEDMEKIMSNPDEEVKLVIGAKDGSQELVVYAKKDATGGMSFALTPSKNVAKAKGDVMRVNVQPDVHDSIIKDPDVYLNQNPTIMQEVMNKEGKTKKLLLQVVSPGKRALVFEVNKKDDYIYTFKRVGP